MLQWKLTFFATCFKNRFPPCERKDRAINKTILKRERNMTVYVFLLNSTYWILYENFLWPVGQFYLDAYGSNKSVCLPPSLWQTSDWVPGQGAVQPHQYLPFPLTGFTKSSNRICQNDLHPERQWWQCIGEEKHPLCSRDWKHPSIALFSHDRKEFRQRCWGRHQYQKIGVLYHV